MSVIFCICCVTAEHYSPQLIQLVGLCMNSDPNKRPDAAYVYEVRVS